MRKNKSALGFSQLGADLVRIKGLSILLLNIKKNFTECKHPRTLCDSDKARQKWFPSIIGAKIRKKVPYKPWNLGNICLSQLIKWFLLFWSILSLAYFVPLTFLTKVGSTLGVFFGWQILTEMEVLPRFSWDPPSLLDQNTRLSNNMHIGNPLKLSSVQVFKVLPCHGWEVTFILNWALVNISLWFFSIEFILFCLLRNEFSWSFLVIWADLYWFLVTCFLALLYSLLWSALVIYMRNSL